MVCLHCPEYCSSGYHNYLYKPSIAVFLRVFFRLDWCQSLWYLQSHIRTARKRKWHFGGFAEVSMCLAVSVGIEMLRSYPVRKCPYSFHYQWQCLQNWDDCLVSNLGSIWGISCPNISNLQLSINRKMLHITHSITILSIHYPNWISAPSFSQKRSTSLNAQWHQICCSFLDSYSYRWNCICAHKRSLFHQDHIISRISYATDNIKHIKHPWFGHSKWMKFFSENNLITDTKELQIWRAKKGQCSCDQYINSNITNLQLKIYVEMNQLYKWFEPLPYRLRLLAVYKNTIALIDGIGLRCTFL